MSNFTREADDMLALQYEHRLPADYPMETINDRISVRAPLWGDTPGLIFKAFATRTRDVAGAASNAYASIYLWNEAAAAADMIGNDRFAAVIAAFGRPQVETMLVLAAKTAGDGAEVASLTREDVLLGPETDMRHLREAEIARAADEVADTDIAAVVSALDVRDWRLVRYRLSRSPVAMSGLGTTYAVRHLARPGWTTLSNERS